MNYDRLIETYQDPVREVVERACKKLPNITEKDLHKLVLDVSSIIRRLNQTPPERNHP